MRKQIAAANWKMNLTLDRAEELLDGILAANYSLKEHQQVIFAVPFPYLERAGNKIAGKRSFFIAAQNCSNKLSGAYTGEVSVEMLQSMNVKHVIIGHSERREYYKEDNQFLKEKVDICLSNNTTPIFCCGEPLGVREENAQNSYVLQQLEESLFHLSKDQIEKIVIAYEPIWAIGTGKTATSAQAQEIHAFIRSTIQDTYNQDIASKISILYGGSVKANNAKELFNQPDVDGGLVGGASLVAEEFAVIINSLK